MSTVNQQNKGIVWELWRLQQMDVDLFARMHEIRVREIRVHEMRATRS